jgi:hypothetical protein
LIIPNKGKIILGEIIMQIEINEKTYVLSNIKGRMLRKAVEISENMVVGKIKATDLDNMLSFVCECYGSKFTIDDMYDSIDANKLLPTISDTISYITGELGK